MSKLIRLDRRFRRCDKLDDMLVFQQHLTEDLIRVCRLLDRICNFGLTIRPSKTYVATTEVVFLGYTIRQGRILPEASMLGKIMSIQ